MAAKSLDKSFYERETYIVAKDLIGKNLIRTIKNGARSKEDRFEHKKMIKLSGTIVETEAYGYKDDKASHAFNGLTNRNKIMFEEVGRIYVYFTYGNHYCFNISAHSHEKIAGAILIRSIEPIDGIKYMKRFRNNKELLDLTSGPGKLTQALRIDTEYNGYDITEAKNEIRIEEGINPNFIIATKRIGIRKATEKYWRFILATYEKNGIDINKFVSSKKENNLYKIC